MLPTHQVWLAIDARQVGGIEIHITHLARDLLARGLNTTIVLVADHGMTPLCHSAEATGAAIPGLSQQP